MVCNIRISQREIARIDKDIQEFAAKVAMMKGVAGGWGSGPMTEGDPRIEQFAEMVDDATTVKAGISEDLYGNMKAAHDHMEEHARAWIAAGMPEKGEDKRSIALQQDIREEFRIRLEAISSITNGLMAFSPDVVAKVEHVDTGELVISADMVAAAIAQATKKG